MRRKMKLIRRILEYIEREGDGKNGVPEPEFDDYSCAQVSYHTGLCKQAGFLDIKVYGSGSYDIQGLTWEGHEKLDELRKGVE